MTNLCGTIHRGKAITLFPFVCDHGTFPDALQKSLQISLQLCCMNSIFVFIYAACIL